MSKKDSGLILTNIHKSFYSGKSKLQVLQNLNLSVKMGEMIAIVGESGTGKTTLLHIIGTIDSPDEGEITLGDTKVSSLNPAGLNRFRNRDIGFVFQFFHLMPDFTLLENVMMPLLVRGCNRTKAEEAALTILRKVGLGGRAEHFPSQLSGGEQQRGSAARALITSPALLLADEPTGNLDPKTAVDIFKLMRELHEETQKITIVVTHNTEIARTCDKIYILKKGTLKRMHT